MSDLFRIYEPWELGADGYPQAWHDLGRGAPLVWTEDGEVDCWDEGFRAGAGPEPYGIKHLVRDIAGGRCVRCRHPYRAGCGEWETLAGESVAAPEGQTFIFGGGDGPIATLTSAGARIHWSPCEQRCDHGGPVRWRWTHEAGWREGDPEGDVAVPDEPKMATVEIQAAWRILTVHHLNNDKRDLRWWNLCALCQRCHLTIQRKVQMERVWPLEHSEWFRPHAAGWYGYAYLGENLSRAETMARLDELLALERLA